MTSGLGGLFDVWPLWPLMSGQGGLFDVSHREKNSLVVIKSSGPF